MAPAVGMPAQPPLQSEPLIAISSILAPGAPPAITLLSEPTLHFSWMLCPLAAAGRFTVVVIYVGAAVVPPDKPVHACLPGRGLPKPVLNVPL